MKKLLCKLTTQDWINTVILLAIFIISFSYIFDKKIDLNGDNIEYYIYAKSLLSGRYTNPMNINHPPISSFPPGYPLLLSIMMLFSKSIVFLKVFTGCLYFIGLWITFMFMSRFYPQRRVLLLVACGVCLFNPDVLDFATMLMSEMSYFLVIALIGYFIYKIEFKNNPLKDKNFWFILLLSGYAYYIRTAGLAVVAAVFFFYLISKKWKYLGGLSVGYILLLLPWTIRAKVNNFGTSKYISTIKSVNAWDKNAGEINTQQLFQRFWHNFEEIITKKIPDALFAKNVNYSHGANITEWLIGVSLLAIIVYGLYKIKKINWYFIGLLLATGATLLPWNGGGGTRYIIAMIPILYIGLFFGVFELGKLIVKKEIILPPLVVLLAILTFIPVKGELEVLHKQAKAPYHPAYKNYFKIAKAVKEKTPKNTIVCCRKPAMFHLFSERYTGKYTFSPDDKVLINNMYLRNFSYVVLEQLGYGSTPKYLYPAIKKNPKVFKIVMHLKNPDTYLLQFDRKEAEKVLRLQEKVPPPKKTRK